MKLKFYDEIKDFARLPVSAYKTELALGRMENPHGLEEGQIKIYTDYLSKEGDKTVEAFIDGGNANIMPLLLKHGVIRKGNVASFCDMAREKRKNDIHFFLLNATNILRSGKALKEFRTQQFIPSPEKSKAGDIIWLGKGPTPWRVLENKNGQLLLLSVYALSCMPYKNFYMETTVWSQSTVRIKLLNEYLNELFTQRDIEKIIPVYIDDKDDSLSFAEKPGVEKDRLFLLSRKEAEKHLKTKHSRMAPATSHCLVSPLWTVFDRYAYWWLRSPGNHPVEKMYVRDGVITSEGSIVNGDWCFDYFGLRPAMYYKP